jgi:hypothetical protein
MEANDGNKRAIQSVGEILTNFLKSGPKSSNHLKEVKATILDIVLPLVTSSEEAITNYTKTCKDFLDKVIQIRGIPTTTILGDAKNRYIVSSSGNHIARKFDILLPKIMERFNWCIENYKWQSKLYLDEQLSEFNDLLWNFLKQVPIGGTKNKSTRSKIAELKKVFRHLTKWTQLFYTYKAMSLPAEIEYIFILEGGPLVAFWHYSQLDEQGEYKKSYNHKERDGRVYAVRGNWAIDKGLMKAEPYGYIDEISRPNQEIGCMCHLQWVYGIRSLPDDMVTEKGRSGLEHARAAMQTENQPQEPNLPAEPGTGRSGLKSRLMRWLGRSGS